MHPALIRSWRKLRRDVGSHLIALLIYSVLAWAGTRLIGSQLFLSFESWWDGPVTLTRGETVIGLVLSLATSYVGHCLIRRARRLHDSKRTADSSARQRAARFCGSVDFGAADNSDSQPTCSGVTNMETTTQEGLREMQIRYSVAVEPINTHRAAG